MRYPPWRSEANPPFPCGFGLKSTVGPAVSVPPHCGDCSLSPTAWPDWPEGQAAAHEDEDDDVTERRKKF